MTTTQRPRKLVPILFSDAMVKALLAGTKTQTRRKVKQQEYIPHLNKNVLTEEVDQHPNLKAGDFLWVRESYRQGIQGEYIYRSSFPIESVNSFSWNNSMFMPRVASRILLRVTEVTMEKLQDISKEDAVAEGIDRNELDPVGAYKNLWNTINSSGTEKQWGANPYVWVIKFQVSVGEVP